MVFVERRKIDMTNFQRNFSTGGVEIQDSAYLPQNRI